MLSEQEHNSGIGNTLRLSQSSSAHQNYRADNKNLKPPSVCTDPSRSLYCEPDPISRWCWGNDCSVVLFSPSLFSPSYVSVLCSTCMFLSLLFQSHQKQPFPLNGPLALLWVCQKSPQASHHAISLICFKGNKIKKIELWLLCRREEKKTSLHYC